VIAAVPTCWYWVHWESAFGTTLRTCRDRFKEKRIRRGRSSSSDPPDRAVDPMADAVQESVGSDPSKSGFMARTHATTANDLEMGNVMVTEK
jgi:hypothetical protein